MSLRQHGSATAARTNRNAGTPNHPSPTAAAMYHALAPAETTTCSVWDAKPASLVALAAAIPAAKPAAQKDSTRAGSSSRQTCMRMDDPIRRDDRCGRNTSLTAHTPKAPTAPTAADRTAVPPRPLNTAAVAAADNSTCTECSGWNAHSGSFPDAATPWSVHTNATPTATPATLNGRCPANSRRILPM